MLIKTDSQNYTNIANAIREVTGSTKQYKPEEMEPALTGYMPECAVSYDTFDSDGYVLTATIYGNTVKGLGGNTKMQSVNIPDTVTKIGSYAFNSCGVTEVNLPSGLTVIEDYGFYSANITNIVLPEGVTTIGECAFCFSELASITLPNSIIKIGSRAFSNSNLESIIFLENITEIPYGLFMSCEKFAISSLPEYITKIGIRSFEGCIAITEFTFHNKIAEISEYAFSDCTGLTTVTFKGTPTKIGSYSYNDTYTGIFEGCTNLTTINVPWSEGEVPYAPWGAPNATINYNYTGE